MSKNIWSIALKTLLYHKWRSLMAVAGGAVGICLIINIVIFGSQMDAALNDEMNSRYGSVDMMVGFRHIEQYMDLETSQRIAELAEVNAHSKILVGSMLFRNAAIYNQPTGIYYLGSDNQWMAKETYGFQFDLQDNEVVLTASLGKRLGAQSGQTVGIPFPDGQLYTWTVKEIIPDRIDSPDMAIFHLPSFQRQFGKEDQVNLLLLDLHAGVDKVLLAHKIRRGIDSTLTVDTLSELDVQRKNIDSIKAFGLLLGFFAVCTSALIVYASLQTSFLQRKRELASIRILGGNDEQIRMLIGLETVFISILAGLLGLSSGVCLSRVLSSSVQSILQIEMLNTPYNWTLLILISVICTMIIAAVALIPGWRISHVSPLIAMKEDYEAKATIHPWHKRIALALFISGLLLCLTTLLLESTQFAIIWGLLLAASVYASIGVISKPLYIGGAWLLYKLRARTAYVALKQIVNDQRRSAMTIAVIALSITIYLPVASVMHTLESSMKQAIHKTYVSDLVITSRFNQMSQLPRHLDQEIAQLQGVDHVIALGTNLTGRLMQFDFSNSNSYWLQERQGNNHWVWRHAVPEREVIGYHLADLAALEKAGLLPPLSVEPESAVIFPKAYADNLGLTLGDSILVSTEGKDDSDYTELVVAGIVENLPGKSGSSDVYVDWSNPLLSERDFIYRLLVQTTSQEKAELGLTQLQQSYPELDWNSFEQALAELRKQIGQRTIIIWSVIGVLLLTGCLGLMNTFSAFLYAKKREFAVLRMIHFTPRQLRNVIFIQCLAIGCVAILAGFVSAYFLIWSGAVVIGTAFVVPWFNQIGILLIVFFAILLVSIAMSALFGRMNLHKAVSMEE